MYYMCLATHAFHCSLCVSLFMSTQAHVQLVVQRWTLKKGHAFLQTWLAIWNTLFGSMLSYVAKFALHVNYYIGKYWFLSLKNMIIINLSFWTCHKKLIRFLSMFTIWIISFETCSISLSVILALGMQKK